MVEATLRMVDPNIPFTAVHASRGKVVRAERAAALYEQQRVHHVGMFPELEDQMCSFTTDFDRQRGVFARPCGSVGFGKRRPFTAVTGVRPWGRQENQVIER